MKEVQGWWVPDYDENLESNITRTPSFAGRATYHLDRFLPAMLRCHDFRSAFDIGAHIGLMTWPMTRVFHQVRAWEPVPDHAECLIRNLNWAGPGNLIVKRSAVGSTDGTVTMALKPPVSLKARVASEDRDDLPLIPGVPIQTLDSYGFTEPVDFIKIDTEGYELNVILGGKDTIRRNRPVMLVEQRKANNLRYSYSEASALKVLGEWGAFVVEEFRGDFLMDWPR